MKYFNLVALMSLLVLVNCSDNDTTIRVLSDQGYTNIQANGYSFFGCGKDDQFHTKFTAKTQTGKTVSGVVCSGWLKGATIRFD